MELSAIVIPTRTAELETIIANFFLWNNESHFPYVEVPISPIQIILSMNNAFDDNFEDKINEAFDSCSNLKSCFSSLSFVYCNLTDSDDLYTRNDYVLLGEYGKVSGPNHQFFETMHRMKDLPGAVLYMETDVMPVKYGWLEDISNEVNSQDAFWVLGSKYYGLSQLRPIEADHINGNAIYAVGDTSFQSFLENIWKPFLLERVAKFPYSAYDMVLPYYISKLVQKGETAESETIKRLIRSTPLIRNYSGQYEKMNVSGIRLSEIVALYPKVALIHGAYLTEQIKVNSQNQADNDAYYEQLINANRANESFNWVNLNRVHNSDYCLKPMVEKLRELYDEELHKFMQLAKNSPESQIYLDELAIILFRISKERNRDSVAYAALYEAHQNLDVNYNQTLFRLAKQKKIVLTVREKLAIVLPPNAEVINRIATLHANFRKRISIVDKDVNERMKQILNESQLLKKLEFDRSSSKFKNDLSYYSDLGKYLSLDEGKLKALVETYTRFDNEPRVIALNELRLSLLDIISVDDSIIVEKIVKGNL